MATDATGTPTSPDNLAKLATSDAPRITSSGGINAIVDSIQTALNTKLKITGSPTSNQVPVWNGSAWVPSLLTTSNLSGNISLSTFSAVSNATLTLSTTPTDIGNATITLGAATTYLICASATPSNVGTGWGFIQVQLLVNGVANTDVMQIGDSGTTTNLWTMGKSWVVTTGGAGQVAKLQGSKGIAAGSCNIGAGFASIFAVKLTAP